jgi:tRNA (Thr-GGU) A37 N-methylase
MKDLVVRPIGIITTPFSQKFGIPRQSQALSKAIGYIHFEKHTKCLSRARPVFTPLAQLFVSREH